jgi:hypothetical protein
LTGSRRLLPAVLVLVAAFLLAPAAANATNRYASPTGTGADPCTVSSPCAIADAVNGATSGDDVTLLGGVPPAAPYTSTASLGLVCSGGCSIINGITVHGAPGARPVINFNTAPSEDGFAVGTGSTLRDDVLNSSSTATNLLEVIGGTAERVSAHNSGTDDTNTNYACVGGSGAVILDSVCWFSGPEAVDHLSSAFAAFTQTFTLAPDTVTLRNDTILADNGNGVLAVAAGGKNMVVSATNVIARGGAVDVETADFGSGTNTEAVNLDHSNYSSRENALTGTSTDPATDGNQTATPEFVDAGTGDFRETAASIGTLDLGTATGVFAGELDPAGLARIQGSAPDIGAFEFVPPPPSGGGTPTTTVAPTTPHGKKCKKGFVKKKVKGKKKCVKKKRK